MTHSCWYGFSRRLRSVVLSTCLAGSASGQTYVVGVCPGSSKAYSTLAGAVSRVSRQEDLRPHLEQWEKDTRLTRFRIEIYRLDPNAPKKLTERQVLVWQKHSSALAASLVSFSGTQSTAGRGGPAPDTQPGDNQRCFFQDTTVVVDTLYIRRGDLSADSRPELLVGGKTYLLPATPDGREWLLSAPVLNGVPTGQYLPATVRLGPADSPRPFMLYLLSAGERSQVIGSLRSWTSADAINCRQLSDWFPDFLVQNWGGKACGSPALYLYAQRQASQRLMQTQRIPCRP